MKKKQALSGTTRNSQYSTDNSQISVADSPRARNGAPPGTVASRVQLLQSLQTSSSPRPGPAPYATPATFSRRRENSRTGFGRRLTSRFGPPACQNAPPYEEQRADTSHSFLGLNTPRSSHVEEHGHADDRKIRYSKSPGINGIAVQVTHDRTQFDAVAPWRSLSRANSSRNMGRRKGRNDMDGNRSGFDYIVAENTKLTLHAHEKDRHAFTEEDRPQESDMVESDTSFATTSTVRRQSVRELFEDYGIERPDGLASSFDSSRETEETPRPTRPHRSCHLCSWVNSGPSTKCWRCSHRLCSVCDAQSPQPVARKEASRGYSEKHMKGKATESQHSLVMSTEFHNHRTVKEETIKQASRRPGPSVIQRSVDYTASQSRRPSTPPVKFPELHPELPSTPDSSQSSHAPKPTTMGAPTGPRKSTIVKDSPFLIADSTAKKKSITLFPFDHSFDYHQHLRNHHEHRLQHQEQEAGQHGSHSSSCASSTLCERVECDVNCEHRHIVLRMKEQGQHHLTKTENGYIADTSRVEDKSYDHSHMVMHASASPTHTPSSFTRPQSHDVRKALHSHHHQQDTTQENCIPEYVECRGYPRTGHIRHGSCSGTELVGECQHCQEDCQCAACQNTHHNVRCCTHKDHKSIVHQHHTPRKEMSTAGLEVQPLSSPRKVSSPPAPVTASPQHPESANTNISRAHISRHVPSSQDMRTAKDSPERVPSLPMNKRSTFMRETSKPPTPPPWVAIPRNSLLRPVQPDPITKPVESPHFPSLLPQKTSYATPTTSEQGISKRKDTKQDFRNDSRVDRHTIPSRKLSKIKEKGSTSSEKITRNSSQLKSSPPGSGKVSRRLSALFQLREEKSAPALTHQDTIQDNQKPRQKHVESAPRGSVASLAQRWEQKKSVPEQDSRQTKTPSRAVSTSTINGRKLRLVDKQPSPPRKDDKPVSEHKLVDDRLKQRPVHNRGRRGISEARLHTLKMDKQLRSSSSHDRRMNEHRRKDDRPDQDRKVMSEARLDTRKRKNGDAHECSWESIALNVQHRSDNGCNHREADNLGIMGVTVVLHFNGKEDMVLRAGSWTTTGETRTLR